MVRPLLSLALLAAATLGVASDAIVGTWRTPGSGSPRAPKSVFTFSERIFSSRLTDLVDGAAPYTVGRQGSYTLKNGVLRLKYRKMTFDASLITDADREKIDPEDLTKYDRIMLESKGMLATIRFVTRDKMILTPKDTNGKAGKPVTLLRVK